MKEDKVLAKLEEHDKRFDQHDKRFDEHDKKFEKLLSLSADHEVRLQNIEEKMVTKDDLTTLRNEILAGDDAQMKILLRLDQERLVSGKRINDLVKDNIKIKKVLKLK